MTMNKRIVTRETLLKQAYKIKADVSQMIQDAESAIENNPNLKGMRRSDLVDVEECEKMCDFADSVIAQVGSVADGD